ncbi:MAG TPA: DMT family transporter [Hyphomicrobiales bacterium]|nr:DMT family transporter [Hyphomicrobiales bacterium]
MTAFLFCINVLVWSFTWIAITVQVKEAPVEIALLYRMAMAGFMLFAILAVSGRLRSVTLRDQPFLALMGFCLFCFNYLLVYSGAGYIASGVVALVFSMATVFNAFNSMVFFGERQSLRFVIGAFCGMTGLGCMFWRDMMQLDFTSSSLVGGGLVLAGTYIFSLGNMVSRRNMKAGLDLPTTTAWGMAWGTLYLALYTLMRGHEVSLNYSLGFYLALTYLAIPGTVIGFLTYLEVVKRLGAPLAAFSTILYPAIALTISTIVENYQWSLAAVIGLALIAFGNLLVFAPAALIRSVIRGLQNHGLRSKQII